MMKLLMAALAIAHVFVFVNIAKAEWVNGYIKDNGTVVNGYIRSAPDNTTINNYGNQRQDTYRPSAPQPSNGVTDWSKSKGF